MEYPFDFIEECISEALESIPKNKKPNIAALAREYRVLESRLRTRYKGRGTRVNYGGYNKTLSDAQELAVYGFLERMESTGIYAREHMFEGAANFVLKSNHTDPSTLFLTVGKTWAARFKKPG